MKLSATIAGAALAATMLLSATAASASAVVTESYDNDVEAAILQVTNSGVFAFSDVTISGGHDGTTTDFGPLAAGATVNYYLGDNETNTAGSQGTALVTVVANGATYSGSFTDVLGDPDTTVAPVSIGTLATAAVPEPTSWAMMLTGFGLLGFAMRKMRSPRSNAVAA